MRISVRAALVAALAFVVLLVAPTSAHAITGGTFDATNKYSNVGIIVFYDAEGRFRCSATLVTPTVLLTAAHCTEGTIGKTIVSFEPFIDDIADHCRYDFAEDGSELMARIESNYEFREAFWEDWADREPPRAV